MNARLDANWDEWQIPREASKDWPPEAIETHRLWWEARIARQQEIDASIAARADYEYLYDKPYEDNRKVRVAGPFTVESLSPHRVLAVDEDDELIDRAAEPRADYGPQQDFAAMILEQLATAGVQQAHKEDRIAFAAVTPWPGEYICAEGRYREGEGDAGPEKRAGIFVGPEFGTVARPDLVAAAREAGDAGFDVLIACAFNYEAHASEFNRLGRIPVLKARMNADLHMADELKNTGKGNLFVVFGEPDIDILPVGGEGDGGKRIQVRINGVDVFHPTTGEVRSDGADGIACWFIDTDYNEESFFVRQAYFLGANDPLQGAEDDAEGRDRRRRVGDAPQRRLAPVRPPRIGPHRRQGHQPPWRRGDEGVPGVSGERHRLSCGHGDARRPYRGRGTCDTRQARRRVRLRCPRDLPTHPPATGRIWSRIRAISAPAGGSREGSERRPADDERGRHDPGAEGITDARRQGPMSRALRMLRNGQNDSLPAIERIVEAWQDLVDVFQHLTGSSRRRWAFRGQRHDWDLATTLA